MIINDKSVQQAVLDELEWDPSVDSAHIGVTARNGIVTLPGHVNSYAEKWSAQRAAGRVLGVKAIAEELAVRYPSEKMEGDENLAAKALQALALDIDVPQNRVKVEVDKGWVTLKGVLGWNYQRDAAETDVRKLRGVIGVTNEITITPIVQASKVRDKIAAALLRNAQIESDDITVTTEGGKVTLDGKVDSWYERSLAANTAWSAPGVFEVQNNLAVN
jgi:osmotically-inducible protein OsmY